MLAALAAVGCGLVPWGAPEAHAQASLDTLLASYKEASFTYAGHPSEPMLYRMLPAQNMESGKKYPLVMHLHSAGAQGTDNTTQFLALPNTIFFAPQNQIRNPNYRAFIAVPQIPSRSGQYGYESDGLDKASTWPNDAIVALTDWLVANYPIDPDRLYITGISMGGAGVWDMLAKRKGKYAAGVIAPGVGRLEAAPDLLATPIWCFMNVGDHPAGPTRGKYYGPRDIFLELQRLGSNVLFTEPKTVGAARTLPEPARRHVYTEYLVPAIANDPHRVEGQAFNERTLSEWLFTQTAKGPVPLSGAGGVGGGGAAGQGGGGAGGVATGGSAGQGDGGSGGSGGSGDPGTGGAAGSGGSDGSGGGGGDDGTNGSGANSGGGGCAFAPAARGGWPLALIVLAFVRARRPRRRI